MYFAFEIKSFQNQNLCIKSFNSHSDKGFRKDLQLILASSIISWGILAQSLYFWVTQFISQNSQQAKKEKLLQLSHINLFLKDQVSGMPLLMTYLQTFPMARTAPQCHWQVTNFKSSKKSPASCLCHTLSTISNDCNVREILSSSIGLINFPAQIRSAIDRDFGMFDVWILFF